MRQSRLAESVKPSLPTTSWTVQPSLLTLSSTIQPPLPIISWTVQASLPTFSWRDRIETLWMDWATLFALSLLVLKLFNRRSLFSICGSRWNLAIGRFQTNPPQDLCSMWRKREEEGVRFFFSDHDRWWSCAVGPLLQVRGSHLRRLPIRGFHPEGESVNEGWQDQRSMPEPSK